MHKFDTPLKPPRSWITPGPLKGNSYSISPMPYFIHFNQVCFYRAPSKLAQKFPLVQSLLPVPTKTKHCLCPIPTFISICSMIKINHSPDSLSTWTPIFHTAIVTSCLKSSFNLFISKTNFKMRPDIFRQGYLQNMKSSYLSLSEEVQKS